MAKRRSIKTIATARHILWEARLRQKYHPLSGYRVFSNQWNRGGIDLAVIDPLGRVIECYEITNYAQTSHMTNSRFNRYMQHFFEPQFKDAEKYLIISYLENLTYYRKDTGRYVSYIYRWNYLSKHGIKVIVEGKQD